MTDTANKLNLTFLHPRTSTAYKANVAPACTAQIAIEGLTSNAFLDPAPASRPYQLVLTRTDTQLTPTQTMAAAGVQNDDVLEVRQQGQGA